MSVQVSVVLTQLLLTTSIDPTEPIAEDERAEKKRQQVFVLTPEVWRVSCRLNHANRFSPVLRTPSKYSISNSR